MDEGNGKLLARVDERTEAILKRMDDFVTKDEFKPVADKIDKLVTHDQFDPVRNVVYGMVSVALLGVAGALIALVV